MASVRCGHHAIRSHEPRAAVRAEHYKSSPRGRRAYSTGEKNTKHTSKRHRGSRGSHRRTSQPSLTTRPTNAHTHKRETSPEPTEPADRTSIETHHQCAPRTHRRSRSNTVPSTRSRGLLSYRCSEVSGSRSQRAEGDGEPTRTFRVSSPFGFARKIAIPNTFRVVKMSVETWVLLSRGLMAFARESRRQFARGPRVASGVFVARRRRKFRWLSTKDEKDKRSRYETTRQRARARAGQASVGASSAAPSPLGAGSSVVAPSSPAAAPLTSPAATARASAAATASDGLDAGLERVACW